MRLLSVLASLGIAVVAVAVAVHTPGGASAKETTIEAENFYFCTEANQGQTCTTEITAGDTVTWSVEEGVHRIAQCADAAFTNCSSGFDSGTLSSGGTFSQTFNTVGTVYYYCAFHPTEMKGALTVAAATAAPTATPSPSAAASAAPTTAGVLPSTGGSPGQASTGGWAYALLALAGLLFAGSGVSFAAARRRLD